MRVLLTIEWSSFGEKPPFTPCVYTYKSYSKRQRMDGISPIKKEQWLSDECQELIMKQEREYFIPYKVVDVEHDDEWFVFFDPDCNLGQKAVVIKELDVDKWIMDNCISQTQPDFESTFEKDVSIVDENNLDRKIWKIKIIGWMKN